MRFEFKLLQPKITSRNCPVGNYPKKYNFTKNYYLFGVKVKDSFGVGENNAIKKKGSCPSKGHD